MKYTTIPSVSGKQLIKLLKKDGWEEVRNATHGISMKKWIIDRYLVTIIPNTSASLPIDTLMDILSVKQTCISKKGLIKLLNKYGL